MFLALDYDDTYTKDPKFWDEFIIKAKESEHTIVCCTYRLEDERWPDVNNDVKEDMYRMDVPIVFAAHYHNKWEAMQKNGYIPENFIWIDDNPQYITREHLL